MHQSHMQLFYIPLRDNIARLAGKLAKNEARDKWERIKTEIERETELFAKIKALTHEGRVNYWVV